ncbi:MAG: N-acetylmuramoyl-L-alanine amidase [Romboutsia timonensis]
MKTQYGFTRFDTLAEFKTWLGKQTAYNYTGLQVHHTYSPSYSNFYKSDGTHEDELTRQYNIKYFHVHTNGWGDIAQHFTVFPNGKIVTGRILAKTTAIGIKGWNTNKICIEIYGNFDKGHDTMTGEQKEAVITLYGELCKKHKITPSKSTIRPHCWFTASGTYLGKYDASKSAKTCPGTNFMGYGSSTTGFAKFIKLVKEYVDGKATTSDTFKKYIGRSTTDDLNCRKGPGTSYDIEKQINKDDVFTVIAEQNNWVKSASGFWCSKKYVEFVRYV